jgi:hypothetical protein
MSAHWWEDDDELLGVVLDALREDQATPTRVVEAGKAAYTWRTVDEDLAALTYDSLTTSASPGTRSERAAVREVTFATRTLTIHVQVSPAGLSGQLVPPQAGALELQLRTRPGQRADVDDNGWFSVGPLVGPAFRLVVELADGRRVHTDWLQV